MRSVLPAPPSCDARSASGRWGQGRARSGFSSSRAVGADEGRVGAAPSVDFTGRSLVAVVVCPYLATRSPRARAGGTGGGGGGRSDGRAPRATEPQRPRRPAGTERGAATAPTGPRHRGLRRRSIAEGEERTSLGPRPPPTRAPRRYPRLAPPLRRCRRRRRAPGEERPRRRRPLQTLTTSVPGPLPGPDYLGSDAPVPWLQTSV